MACPDNNCNDCYQNDCLPSNPCYENCGCINPTTAECVEILANFPNLGITKDMNLKEALAQLELKIVNPYNKITQTQRLAMTSTPVGTHVYQTDGQEGVWVFKSTGWEFAY